MEGIKKKMANLKLEKDEAVERAEQAEKEKKEAELRADEVSISYAQSRVYMLSLSHVSAYNTPT